MSVAQLPCPQWVNPEPSDKLDSIVKAAVAIYEFILRQNPKKYCLEHGDLKTWHGKLFKEAVPVPYYAGNYRSPDKRYPCLITDVYVSGVSGAPYPDVLARMQEFSQALATLTSDTDKFIASQKADVVKLKAAVELAAFATGNIIQIHPFLNGNGRVARLTANFFLNRYGFRMPFFIDRPAANGPEYASASAAAMSAGNFVPLYRYLIALLAS